jgi:hypothetical protein
VLGNVEWSDGRAEASSVLGGCKSAGKMASGEMMSTAVGARTLGYKLRTAPLRQGASVGDRLQLGICFVTSLAAAESWSPSECGRWLQLGAESVTRHASGRQARRRAVRQHSRWQCRGLYGREKQVSIYQGRRYVVKCLASCTVQAPTSRRVEPRVTCDKTPAYGLARHHDTSRAAPAA